MVILHGRMLNGWKSVPQQRVASSGHHCQTRCIHPRLKIHSCKGRTLTHPSVKGGENRAAPAVASSDVVTIYTLTWPIQSHYGCFR